MSKMPKLIVVVDIRLEHDIVLARQRSRQIAALLDFSHQDQSRISTAVSEIARNAFNYANGGKVEFSLEDGEPQALAITVRDKGPGIADLDSILNGQYISRTGLGLGLVGAKRLMDDCDITSKPGKGTTVVLRKHLPSKSMTITGAAVAKIADELAHVAPRNLLEEVQQQNRELLRTLEELRARQADLARLNRELEDTNRGVVALYAELDERADHLQRANELKTRFLSNMSHEFRTPLNAILGLTRILLSRADGDLTPEQEKQANYIRRSAEDLSELVNDLLDLARVEAGKIVVRPHEFDVPTLFSTLRGMLRPLLVGKSLELVFEDPDGLPVMCTDDSKIAQILRNFISNALKFTERGEVRVSAKLSNDRQAVVFSVADTGIGIAEADQERIFQEWTQVESPLQRKAKGTGLGLPLSRRLCELLGGTVCVQSEVGVGSTFYASVPVVYRGAGEAPVVAPQVPQLEPGKLVVMAVEDNRETLLSYESHLRETPYQLITATRLADARRMIQQIRPAAVILDILLGDESTWTFLTELKSNPVTKPIPVMVATVIDNAHKARALGADEFQMKPVERVPLLHWLQQVTSLAAVDKVLIVDDEEISRYLLKGLLSGVGMPIVEAGNAADALRMARQLRPRVIFLDLMMPEVSGYELLAQLRSDPLTSSIPVIINTSKALTQQDCELLLADAAAIVLKESASQQHALASIRAALAKVGITLEKESQHAD